MDVRVDAWAAQGAARRMCSSQNLSISFDLKHHEPPYTTNGNRIHIDPPTAYFSKDDMTHWWAKLIHETRHNTVRGKQCFDTMEKWQLNSESLYGGLFNLFEDGVVDNIGRGKYLGQDQASSWGHGKIVEGVFNNPEAVNSMFEASPDTMDEAHKALGTSLILDSIARQAYMPDLIGLPEQLISREKFNPDLKALLDKAIDRGWLDSLRALQEDPEKNTSEDVYQWVKDYVEDMFDLPPPPEEKPEDDDSGDSDDDGDGEGTGEGTGEGAQAGESADGENGGAAEDGDEKGILDSTDYLFKELQRDTHEQPDVRVIGASHSGQTVTYGAGSGRYEPATPDQFVVADFHRKTYSSVSDINFPTQSQFVSFINNAKKYEKNRYEEQYEKMKVKDSLANEVKRHIQSETRQKVTRNKKKGKLDQRKLFKLGVPDAGSDWQDRVFWNKEIKMTVDNTVVSLLMDNSGSMGGAKICAAIHAMDLIGDVLNTINVDFEMAGFTTSGWNENPFHLIYKPFGAKMMRSQIVENMLIGSNQMSGNPDGDCIQYAYNRLKAQEAKRRILIVLSDGQPAAGGGDISWYTREVCTGIEQEGLVELHGIGIMSNAVRDFYKSCDVLDDPSQLESKLLSVLKNNVLRLTK